MKTVGIIAEFNPFHNGHKYLIDKAKKITNADNVIIITSGNFVQRGNPAFIDKSIRSKIAVNNGVDAVFELPVCYSTASAELFARAGIAFFDKLNCVDYICFGCETDNLKILPKVACLLNEEPEQLKLLINNFTKQGLSFPKARMEAMCQYCSTNSIAPDYEIREILSSPNNILAIEYLKAIKHFNSKIKPVAIKRIGAGYESSNLEQEYASATGIREAILSHNINSLKDFVPQLGYDDLINSKYLVLDDFSAILGCKLVSETIFSKYIGINEDLSNRINSLKKEYTNISAFISSLQSKNYTYSAISRALMHIQLSIEWEKVDKFINNGYHTFAKLLAFNKNSKILSHIKANSSLTIISKLYDYYNSCDEISKEMLDMCIGADNLYRLIYMMKHQEKLPLEFERQIYVK